MMSGYFARPPKLDVGLAWERWWFAHFFDGVSLLGAIGVIIGYAASANQALLTGGLLGILIYWAPIRLTVWLVLRG